MTYSKARKLALRLAAAVPATCLALLFTAVTCLLAWSAGDSEAACGLFFALLAIAALALLWWGVAAAWALGERLAQEVTGRQTDENG